MRITRRAGAASAATLVGLALTVLVAHALAPDQVRGLGLDVWNLPTAEAARRAAAEESAAIGAQADRLYKELELSDSVCERLAAGTVTLDAAVRELEPVLRTRAGFDGRVQRNYGAPTFRHSVARYLIQRLPRTTGTDPGTHRDVIRRLEEEYTRLRF